SQRGGPSWLTHSVVRSAEMVTTLAARGAPSIDDSARKHIRAFTVRPDGTLSDSRVLLDMASDDPGVPDGLKVDREGNVFCTGPGGVWVCRPSGQLLGRIVLPELPANLAWGEDGSALFFTARTSIYRLQTRTRGSL